MSNNEHTEGYELVIRPRSLVSLSDLADIWRYRELLWTLASRDILVRYKQAAFGVAWAVIQPIAQMMIFTLVFHEVAGIKGDAPVSYKLFTFAGVVIWSMFSTGLQASSLSLVENSRVITKVYFPRVLVPLSSVVVSAVDFAIGLALLLAAVPLFGASFHASMLLIPFFALLAAAAALSIGLVTSALSIQYRDVRYALPFFVQLLIFLTPVFYPTTFLPEQYRFILLANPMAAVVDGFRAVMFGTAIPWDRLGISVATIAVIGSLAFVYFRRMEQSFADRV